jgi:hypothetical protein
MAKFFSALLMLAALGAGGFFFMKNLNLKGGGGSKASDVVAKAPQKVNEDDYAMQLFSRYTECYARNNVNGQIDGKLVAALRADGTVADVSYEGKAPKPVRKCLVETYRARKLDNYTGEPGRVLLSYDGTFSNGMEMLNESWKHDRISALPPAHAEALRQALGESAAPAPTNPPPTDKAPAKGK